MAQQKIFIVDNELEIIQMLSLHLSREGYSTSWTTNPEEALSSIEKENPDLIILDVVMPSLSGIDLCSMIREQYDIPIIFLSCKNEVSDKVLGLSIGGDDYMTKPFSTTELIARIKANLKRSYQASSGQEVTEHEKELCCPEIKVSLEGHTCLINGTELQLTSKEFDLLVLFMKSPNRVFTPKQIFEHLWDNYGYEDDYRTVMVHVSNLRKKLQPFLKEENPIHTIRGVGYKLVSRSN